MDLSGYVYDNATGTGLPGASVVVADKDGKAYAKGVSADETGYFFISSDLLNQGAYLLFSSVGYQSVLVSPNVLSYSGDIGLVPASDDLVSIVVKHVQRNPLWLLLVPAIVLLIITGQKKKAITGVQLHTNEWVDLAIKIGIPVAAYFLVVAPLLKKLGLLPDAEDKAQSVSDAKAKEKQLAMKNWNANENHTYTQSFLDGLAVALRNDTGSWMGYQWADLSKQFSYLSALTTADARYLIGAFVEKNGLTMYRWYFEDFADAVILTEFDYGRIYWVPGWLGSGQPIDYRANYERIGVNESNADYLSWRDVAVKWVTYVYQLAGATMQ